MVPNGRKIQRGDYSHVHYLKRVVKDIVAIMALVIDPFSDAHVSLNSECRTWSETVQNRQASTEQRENDRDALKRHVNGNSATPQLERFARLFPPEMLRCGKVRRERSSI